MEEGKRIGRLLANIHSIDISWFDGVKAEIVRVNPALKHVKNESLAWLHFAGWFPIKQFGISSLASIYRERGFDRFMHKLPPETCILSLSVQDLMRISAQYGGTPKTSEEEWVGSRRTSANVKDDCWIGTHDCVDRAVLDAWAGTGTWTPQHPVARRSVTSHGDFHLGNVLVLDDDNLNDTKHGNLMVLDFDMACVTSASADLAWMVTQMATPENKRAFLQGYLEGMGEIADETIELLLLDCELAQLGSWASGGHLGGMDIGDRRKADVLDLIFFCEHFSSRVRGSDELQRRIKSMGLSHVLNEMHSSGTC